MTAYPQGSVSLSALSGTDIEVRVNTIQDRSFGPTPEVTFTTSPQGATYVYTAGLNNYTTSAKYTPSNTVITFTATTRFPEGVKAVSHEWNFGDGQQGWGTTTTHTYKLSSGQPQASLCVTDSNGKKHYARRQIYLSTP